MDEHKNIKSSRFFHPQEGYRHRLQYFVHSIIIPPLYYYYYYYYYYHHVISPYQKNDACPRCPYDCSILVNEYVFIIVVDDDDDFFYDWIWFVRQTITALYEIQSISSSNCNYVTNNNGISCCYGGNR